MNIKPGVTFQISPFQLWPCTVNSGVSPGDPGRVQWRSNCGVSPLQWWPRAYVGHGDGSYFAVLLHLASA
eukprot:5252622-Pyramimonas_sp.AAC.1